MTRFEKNQYKKSNEIIQYVNGKYILPPELDQYDFANLKKDVQSQNKFVILASNTITRSYNKFNVRTSISTLIEFVTLSMQGIESDCTPEVSKEITAALKIIDYSCDTQSHHTIFKPLVYYDNNYGKMCVFFSHVKIQTMGRKINLIDLLSGQRGTLFFEYSYILLSDSNSNKGSEKRPDLLQDRFSFCPPQMTTSSCRSFVQEPLTENMLNDLFLLYNLYNEEKTTSRLTYMGNYYDFVKTLIKYFGDK